MKKNTIKAFTLVEMLIVIVIIGILIASLMPRMQTAQGRARDVARKNDLSQIQTAIITSQSDRGAWPGMKNNTFNNIGDSDEANDGLAISGIHQQLLDAGMSEIPTDPNGSNVNYGLGDINDTSSSIPGQYIYMVGRRNGVSNAGFVLMAKTEVEGSSNWVVCASGATNTGLSGGYITSTDDLAHVQLCRSITKGAAASCVSDTENCVYSEAAELRYILLY